MSALQTFMLVADQDKEEAFRIAESTAKELENKQTTLIDVVQSLGEYINEEDAILRGKAVSYLTAVIKALPPRFLSRQQIQVLTTFFCDRIEDGGAIAGLDTLQGLERFHSEMAKDIARAIFEHHEVLQSRPQSQRFQVYRLLNELMANHRSALHELGDESLVGVVDLMTGEKDPRNLMIVFSILRVIMVEWDISNHAELLFDSVFNYFPITFRPPPNDPYGITAQDLKDRLQTCISSNSLFAPYAFPALLDKLDSTSTNVKRDVLHALLACVTSYHPNTVSRYSNKIWNALKFEILNAQEDFLSDLSLQVLQAIAERLSDRITEVSPNLPLAQYLKPIIRDCNEQLREPQQKQAKPSRQILRSVSSASISSFTLIVESTVAPLFSLYQDADSIAKQRAFLEAFISLFDSSIELYGKWADRSPAPAVQNPLATYQDRLTEVLSQALMGTSKEEVSFRQTALQGLLRLSTLRHFFKDNEIGLFVQYLDEILLQEAPVGSGQLRKDAIAALAEISRHKPRVIMEITLPAFMATLPDTADGEDTRKYVPTLETLAQISVEKDIFETLVRRLLGKFDFLLQAGTTDPTYPRAILLTIVYAMGKRAADRAQTADFEAYYDRIVVGLCRKAAAAAVAESDPSLTILRDVTVLDTIGRLCTLIVRSISREKQVNVAENVYTLFTTPSESFKPVPFAQTRTLDRCRTMILSTYLLAGLPKDITSHLPYTNPDMLPLLDDLVQLSISTSEIGGDAAIHLAILRHIAVLANKFLPNASLPLVTEIFASLLPPPPPPSSSSPSPPANVAVLPPQTIKTLFWLGKALVLRLAPSTPTILSSLVSLLSSPDKQTAQTAARGFRILLAPDEVLSTANGANIRLLAKQRVFTSIVPLIAAKIRDTSPTQTTSSHVIPAHLAALAGILPFLPPDIITPDLLTLLPLLLRSLDLDQKADNIAAADDDDSDDPSAAAIPAVKTATLDTLAAIIRTNGVRAIDQSRHVPDLVRRLLRIASSSSSSSITRAPDNNARPRPKMVKTVLTHAKVREAALRCLQLLALSSSTSASAPPDLDSALAAALARPTGSTTTTTTASSSVAPLLQVKKQVLRTLALVLDDPRRDVRKAAVDARAAWLRNVEDPKEEDDD